MQAYSPIVVAGAVRVIEVVLVAADRLSLIRRLCGADGRLQPRLFRRHRRHLGHRAAARFRPRTSIRCRRSAATKSNICGSLRPGRSCSCSPSPCRSSPRPAISSPVVWLGSYYAVGLITLLLFRRGLFLLVRRWTRQGRLDRRTVVVGAGAKRRRPDRGDVRPARFRRAHRRRVRRPRRRPLLAGLRRRAQARHRRRSRRIRAPDPRRSRDLLAADLGGRAASCRC